MTIPPERMRFDLGGFWGASIYAGIDNFPYPSDTPQASFLALSFTRSAATVGVTEFAPPNPKLIIGTATSNASSCAVCPVVLSDVWGDNATNAWFPVSGRIVVQSAINPSPDQPFLNNPETGQYVGRLEGLVFERLHYLDLPWAWQGWETSSDCICLSDTSFDTRLVDGRACTSAEDCGHPQQSCDPASETCTTRQCSVQSDAVPCTKPEELCIAQAASVDVGGCYRACDTRVADACGAGRACVGVDYTGTVGTCRALTTSPTEPWSECSPDDVTTSCSAGQICADPSAIYVRRCYPMCDYFATDPGCPLDARCVVTPYDPIALKESWACGQGGCYEGGGICRRDSQNEWWVASDVMRFGDPCSVDQAGYACGFAEGSRKLGVCRDLGSGVVCHEHCRMGTTCVGGTACQQLFIDGDPGDQPRQVPGLGVCP